MVSNPSLWLNSVFSLLKDPLFPFGTGPVTLVTFGYLKIQSSLPFLTLEVAAMLAGIVWYWFKARRYPAMGIILSVLPMFFAWRSLWPYFFYVDVILLATVIVNEYGFTKDMVPSPFRKRETAVSGEGFSQR